MHTFLPYAHHEWTLKPFTEANISIATHAFHYGTGCWGGMRWRYVDGHIELFRLDKHVERLSRSAQILSYELSESYICESIMNFIQKNMPKTDIYLRPMAYVSELWVVPKIHDKKDFCLYGIEMGEYLAGDGVSVCQSSWTRPEDRSIPLRGKMIGSYLSSSLAKSEALNRGFDEALIMNSQGKICEGSAMNIFIVRDGILITPWVEQDILEGITRKSIIELAQYIGITVVERPIDKSEIIVADEVFLTGSAAKVTSVHTFEQFTLPSHHPVTDQLLWAMNDVYGWGHTYSDKWITKVKCA